MQTNNTPTTPIPIERGAHTLTLIELALARGLVIARITSDETIVLLGDRGAILVPKRSRTTSVRVLLVGEDEWRTIDVAIAPDISPIARVVAGLG